MRASMTMRAIIIAQMPLLFNVAQQFPSIVLAILLERQLCNIVEPSMTISEPQLHLS